MWRSLILGILACGTRAICPEPSASTPENDPSAAAPVEAPPASAPAWSERLRVCSDPLDRATHRCRTVLNEAGPEHAAEVVSTRIHHCLRNPTGTICRESSDALEHTCLEGGDDDACLAIAGVLRQRRETRECAARFHRHACREANQLRRGDCIGWDRVALPLIHGDDAEDCPAPVLNEVLVESPRSLDEAIEALEHVTSHTLSTFWIGPWLPREPLVSMDGSSAVFSINGNEATSRTIAFVDRRGATELPVFSGVEYHALASATDTEVREHVEDTLAPRLVAIRDRLAPRYRPLEAIENDGFFELRLEDSPSAATVSIHARDGRRLWRRRFRFRTDEECVSETEAAAWWDPPTRSLLVVTSRPHPDACNERELVLDTLPL